MATHDYVIDNSTGANVRADINNVLQAILTNNSSSSSPSTTAAYMFWADTTSGTLKIRNSSDNAWVELLQLDGTLTLEDGSASTPGLAFRDDLNTGIFSSAADTFNVATAGVERMELGATTIFNEDGADVDFRIEGDTVANLFYVDAGNDRVGINTNSPLGHLGVKATGTSGTTASAGYDEFVIEGGNEAIGMCFLSPSANNCTQRIAFGDSNNNKSGLIAYHHGVDAFEFDTGGSERARIDSSGRVLIGTSSARTNFFNTSIHIPRLQVESTNDNNGRAALGLVYGKNDFTGPYIVLAKHRSNTVGDNTVIQSGDETGIISFQGSDGSQFVETARIESFVDGTPGANDMPGRLVFSTTADGATDITQAMRIRSDQRIVVGTSSGTGYTGKFGIHGATDLLDLNSSGSSTAGKIKFYEGGAGRMNIETLGGTSGLLIYDSLNAATRVKIAGGGVVLIGLSSSGGNVQYLETNQPQSSNFACAMFQSSTSSSLSGTHALRIQGHGFNSAFQGAHGIKFVNADDQDRGYQAILFKKADASTNVGSISYNQNSTSYNTSSDYRLKENAVAISDGITRLKTLKPYRFNFKDNPSKTVDGFFAHECTAVPEAITGEKDGMKAISWYQEGDTIPSGKAVGMTKTYSSTEMEIQSLDQSKLVPLLVAAVQELITKVETLEAA